MTHADYQEPAPLKSVSEMRDEDVGIRKVEVGNEAYGGGSIRSQYVQETWESKESLTSCGAGLLELQSPA